MASGPSWSHFVLNKKGLGWQAQNYQGLNSNPCQKTERSKPEKASTQKQKEPTQEIEIHGAVQQLNIVCDLFTQTHTWLHGESKWANWLSVVFKILNG